MPAPAPEQAGTRTERGVQVEHGDRPAGSLPVAVGACDQHYRAVVALNEARGDDADHTLVPVGPGNGVGAAGTLFRRPRLDLRDCLAENAAFDRLTFAVQLLQRGGEPACLGFVFGEEQLEGLARVPEAPGSVQARCEAEADGSGIDSGRIDAGALHERPETGLRRAGQGPKPGDRERPVLVDEWNNVGDGREGDEVEMTPRDLGVDAEERLSELVHDSRATKLGERVGGRARGDDRTVGQRLSRPVMVGDDYIEATFSGLGDLGDGRDSAVDGEDDPAALVREPCERLAADAVALVEATREMPGHVGA